MANKTAALKLFGKHIVVEVNGLSDIYLRLFGKDIVVEVNRSSDPKSDDQHERAAGMCSVDTPSSSCIIDDAVPVSTFSDHPSPTPVPTATNPQPVSWDGASTSSKTGEDGEQRKKAGKRKQQDIGGVEKKRRSAKRRRSDGEVDLGEIPPGLLQAIESRNGTNLVSLYRKVLNKSDVNPGLNRLFIGGKHKFFDSLDPSEISALDDSKRGLEVWAIDPQEHSLRLKKWLSLDILIPNVDWNKMVRANKADVGDCVRIWGYRVEGKLCLAITFDKNNNSGSSSNTAEKETSKVVG